MSGSMSTRESTRSAAPAARVNELSTLLSAWYAELIIFQYSWYWMSEPTVIAPLGLIAIEPPYQSSSTPAPKSR